MATVSSTVEGGYSGLDRKLKDIAARAKKHLASNPRLLQTAWRAIESAIVGQLETFEEDMQACFPDVRIPVAAAQVAQLLKGSAPV